MTTQEVSEQVIRYVLTHEQNSIRFERFCIDLYSVVDGLNYVPTAKSWDRGRDGRAVDSRGDVAVICCTLEEGIVAKAEKDATQLLAHVRPARIRFCCSVIASEHKLDEAKTKFVDGKSPEAIVVASGQDQLAWDARKHPEAFLKHYAAEIDELQRFIKMTIASEEPSRIGMRIALSTQLNAEAAQLRQAAFRSLILFVLGEKSKLNVAEVAKSISDHLHLGTVMSGSHVATGLAGIQSDGLVECIESRWSLTPKGVVVLGEMQAKALKELQEGENIVRAEVEKLVGAPLSSSDFKILWTKLREGIALLFHTNGLTIATAATAILDGEIDKDFGEELSTSIEKLAADSTALISELSLRETLHQAVLDLFLDRSNPAFQWLASVAEVYVMLCALGLDSRAQNEIQESLRHRELVLDTDVVINLLCSAEPDHLTVLEAVRAWVKLGSHVFVTESVLEEVAYHAWISDREFLEIQDGVSNLDELAARRLVENAFVRAFLKESPRNRSYRAWKAFSRSYRGQSEYDTLNVSAALDDLGVGLLSSAGRDNGIVAAIEVRVLPKKHKTNMVMKTVIDKTRRDGQLVADAYTYCKKLAEISSRVIIVSGSRHLREATIGLFDESASSPILAHPSAIAYLASLIASARLTESSLRAALFDAGLTSRLVPMERRALRVLCVSREYQFPFSKRHMLRKQLERGVDELSKQLGLPKEEVQAELSIDSELARQHFVPLLGKSLDELIESKSAKRLLELEAENRKLRGKA